MANPKTRLDLALVDRGLIPSRAKAQAAIMAGMVLVDGRPVTKAGTPISEDAEITLKAKACPYVSRGGLKLEAALRAFTPEIKGHVCLDVGASTGGFTDCLLQNGAKSVYAVDVGHGQLDLKLREDKRVVNLEKTHARDLTPEAFSPSPDLATIDVAFISLTAILPAVVRTLSTPFQIIALVKPQFELSAKEVPKGVVREQKSRLKAVERVRECLRSLPVKEVGLIDCPVHGPKGNIEFLLYLRSQP